MEIQGKRFVLKYIGEEVKGTAGGMEENQIKETLQRILESLERIEVILQKRDDPVGFAESLSSSLRNSLCKSREAKEYEATWETANYFPGDECQVSFSLPNRDWLLLEQSALWKNVIVFLGYCQNEDIRKSLQEKKAILEGTWSSRRNHE